MTAKQLGLDMLFTDPHTQAPVPWAMPERALFQRIAEAPWKVVDVETTGLNPASKEQKFSGKELRRGADPRLRLRVMSVVVPCPLGAATPTEEYAFDFDQLTEQERQEAAAAVMSEVFIGHNAGFDLYWVGMHTQNMPRLVLDTMLLARVLCPEHPLNMARRCKDENEDPELVAAAESMFIAERSGWSLADLSAGLLRKVMSKKLQGPKNWCQPFLSQSSYDYALGDARDTLAILLHIFEIDKPEDVLTRYAELREENPVIRLIEPQVKNIVEMRRHGMPWSQTAAREYIGNQRKKVAELATALIAHEPSLEPFKKALSDANAGITDDLKEAIGKAFEARGLALDSTAKTGAFKIGEKDLRRAKAQVTPEASKMFDMWTALNRAKKAMGMAQEVSGFAARAYDGMLHPNTGHGPVTGRLASSEPNCQQFPRDQGFRNGVTALPGYKIVALDFSALDMRVGAALAIRAQRQIFEAYMGDRGCPLDVLRCIERVFNKKVTPAAARDEEAKAKKAFAAWKDRRDSIPQTADAARSYWDKYRKLAHANLLAGFQRCLAEVRERADQDQTCEWSSLRDAFAIPDMDIHTWTALDMIGRNPKEMFRGFDSGQVVSALKQAKEELGPQRQTGKVGNLSLLYAMQAAGLVDAAAKQYNIHWSIEEGTEIRTGWLAAYIEIDLWHKWTELNPVDEVFIPDADRGGRYSKKKVYASYTLGNRLIYAFGLNAALSYEDQSTGADILAVVMDALEREHSEIFDCVVNQVHDEIVLHVPEHKVDAFLPTLQEVMVSSAHRFTMPYGVHVECSTSVGDVWLKD